MSSDKSNGYKYHDRKTVIGDDELFIVFRAAQRSQRDVFKARDLEGLVDFNSMQIGRRLAKLENRKLIERVTSDTPHRWRLIE